MFELSLKSKFNPQNNRKTNLPKLDFPMIPSCTIFRTRKWMLHKITIKNLSLSFFIELRTRSTVKLPCKRGVCYLRQKQLLFKVVVCAT